MQQLRWSVPGRRRECGGDGPGVGPDDGGPGADFWYAAGGAEALDSRICRLECRIGSILVPRLCDENRDGPRQQHQPRVARSRPTPPSESSPPATSRRTDMTQSHRRTKSEVSTSFQGRRAGNSGTGRFSTRLRLFGQVGLDEGPPYIGAEGGDLQRLESAHDSDHAGWPSESFTYAPSGKLATITEVGVAAQLLANGPIPGPETTSRQS